MFPSRPLSTVTMTTALTALLLILMSQIPASTPIPSPREDLRMSAGSHSAGSSSAGSHWPSVMGQNNTDVSKGLPEDVINNLKGICKDFDIATKGEGER